MDAVNTSERQARNDRIMRLRSRGVSVRAIASEVGLSDRQCSRLIAERSVPLYGALSSEDGVAAAVQRAPSQALLDQIESAIGILAGCANGACEATNVRALFV